MTTRSRPISNLNYDFHANLVVLCHYVEMVFLDSSRDNTLITSCCAQHEFKLVVFPLTS